MLNHRLHRPLRNLFLSPLQLEQPIFGECGSFNPSNELLEEGVNGLLNLIFLSKQNTHNGIAALLYNSVYLPTPPNEQL